MALAVRQREVRESGDPEEVKALRREIGKKARALRAGRLERKRKMVRTESLAEADRLGANLRRWEARRKVELADLREKLEALSAQYRKEEAEQ